MILYRHNFQLFKTQGVLKLLIKE